MKLKKIGPEPINEEEEYKEDLEETKEDPEDTGL